jgi:hypothetical protein
MKKNATVEDYMAFGADCKLLKALFIKVMCNNALLDTESDELHKLASQFDDFISKQEDKMLQKYPNLPNEYLRVFYGPLNREPLDEKVDKTVIDMAKQTAEKLFER